MALVEFDCPKCEGHGIVERGLFDEESCPVCRGEGRVAPLELEQNPIRKRDLVFRALLTVTRASSLPADASIAY